MPISIIEFFSMHLPHAAVILVFLFLATVDAAQFTQARARIPCKAKRDFRCPVHGTHTRLGVSATVLQQPNGGLNITGYPISHLGSFLDGPNTYDEIEFNAPNICLRKDYCVGIAENVTFDLYVSPVKARYPLTPWLNGVPYDSFWMRTSNLTEAAVNGTQAPSLPPTDCLPYNTPTDGAAYLPFQCETAGLHSVTDADLDLYASGCNSTYADPLPDLTGDAAQPMTASAGARPCSATVCPPCAAESQTGTDVMQFVTVHSVECMAMGILQAPQPFVEVLLTVRNHDTGERHQLYSLASVGRSGSIVTVGDSPLRMRIQLSPTEREGNVRDAAAPLLGDSIMVCGQMPHAERRLRNPFAHADFGAHVERIPVPTRRYTASLTPGAQPDLEVAQPAWYWMPQEDNAIYGRRCGQVGALSQSLNAVSAANIYDYCYDPSVPPTCLPPTSPRCILAGLNIYSQNAAVLAALRAESGSDPALIASQKPINMPPRSVWNDLYPRTYLATVADPNTRNFQGFRPSLIVEHVPRAVPDSGYRVEVTFDIADSLLPDPFNAVGTKVYHQKLSPTATTCSLFTAAQGGWGGLSLTFCTVQDLPIVSANGGRRLYEALVECDESVGQMASGYEGTEIINSSTAIVRFQASVGGPANRCTQVANPIAFAPRGDPYGQGATSGEPNEVHYAGSCRVTLRDGLLNHIGVGPPNQLVDCIRYASAGQAQDDTSHVVYLDERPNCDFFNVLNTDCADSGSFNILALMLILGVLGIVAIILLIVAALWADTCYSKAKTDAVKKKNN